MVVEFKLKMNGEIINTFIVQNRRGIISIAEDYLKENFNGVFRKEYEDSYCNIGWYCSSGFKFVLVLV
jgi:hypothetical protein